MRKSPFSAVNAAFRVRVLSPLSRVSRGSGLTVPSLLRRAVERHLHNRRELASLATWRRAMAVLSHEHDTVDF